MIKMKWLHILLLSFISLTLFSQNYSFDLSEVSGSDTSYVLEIKTGYPISISWDFEDFDADDATLTVYYANKDNNGERSYMICDNLNIDSTQYPITLNTSTYQQIVNSDTSSAFGVNANTWEFDEIWFKITLNNVSEGTFKVFVRRR